MYVGSMSDRGTQGPAAVRGKSRTGLPAELSLDQRCLGTSEGYVGRYVGRGCRGCVGRVCRKGMSERCFNGMSDKYVGRVCRKACREGMSESGSGGASSAPAGGADQGDIESGTRPYIYIYTSVFFNVY